MKLGDLLVVLKANTVEFSKGFTAAIETVDKLARQVKRATAEIGQAGLGLAAVAGGAVALAATVDKGISKQLDNLKHSFEDLAVPVAKLVVPAMRELATWVRQVADYIAGLSPHTKLMIMNFFEIAAAVGATALILSKIAAAIQGLAGVFALVTAAPFLAVIAVLAVVIALALTLHKAWRENWGGIQEVTRSVIQNLTDYFSDFTSFTSTAFDVWANYLIDVQTRWAKGYVAILRMVGKITEDQFQAMSKALTMGQFLASGTGRGMATIKVGAKMISDAAVTTFDALAKELGIVVDEVKGKLGLGANGGHAVRHGDPLFTSAEAQAARYGQLAGNASQLGGDRVNRSGDLSIAQMRQDAADQFAQRGLAHNPGELQPSNISSKGFTFANEDLDRGLKIQFAERLRVEASFGGQISKIGDAFKTMAGTMLSKLGDAGQIISAGMQGFATAGPWGAIIAVVMEIVSRMASFTKVLDYFNSNISAHIDRLSKVFEPLFNALQSFSETMDALTNAFPPIQWAFTLLKGILWVFEKAIIGLGIALLTIAKAFADLGGGDKGLNDQLKKLQDQWNEGFDDNIGPVNTLGDAAQKTADKLDEMTTNLPSGYKLHAAQFGADGATAIGGAAAGGSSYQQGWMGSSYMGGASMGIAIGPNGQPYLPAGAGFNAGQLGVGSSKAFNSQGGMAGGNYTGIDPNASTGSDMWGGGNPGDTWSFAQLALYAAAYSAAKAAGATDEQATQAGTMAANGGGGRGSSSSAATAATSSGSGSGIHSVGSPQTSAVTELHIHGDLHVAASDPISMHRQLAATAAREIKRRHRNGQ